MPRPALLPTPPFACRSSCCCDCVDRVGRSRTRATDRRSTDSNAAAVVIPATAPSTAAEEFLTDLSAATNDQRLTLLSAQNEIVMIELRKTFRVWVARERKGGRAAQRCGESNRREDERW